MDNKGLEQRVTLKAADVARKVLWAIMATGDEESIDYDAALDGVAITVAYVFKQYIETADSSESFDSLSHDLMDRLDAAYMAMRKRDGNGAG